MRPFSFPPLGDTGAGDPPYPRDYSRERGAIWQSGSYGVSHQNDRPAVAFRCHYPGGSSPCDLETAMAFVAHVASEDAAAVEEECVFCGEKRGPDQFEDGLRCKFCAEEQDEKDPD